MKISTVTVCYNSERTIGHAVESFLAQTYSDKEMILVDGGSNDRTLEIASSLAGDRVRIISEPDNGIYDAMNKGLRLFKGDAVGFLNSDDRYADSGVLGAVAEALAEAQMVCGNIDFVTDHDTGEIVRRWRGSPCPKGGFRAGWMPAHPTFYARREVIERVGEFDTSLKIAADYDFMLRAVEFGDREIAHIDRTLVHMMVGGASTSGARAFMKGNLESLRSRRKWLGAPIVDYAFFAKPLGKLGQFLVGRSD